MLAGVGVSRQLGLTSVPSHHWQRALLLGNLPGPTDRDSHGQQRQAKGLGGPGKVLLKEADGSFLLRRSPAPFSGWLGRLASLAETSNRGKSSWAPSAGGRARESGCGRLRAAVGRLTGSGGAEHHRMVFQALPVLSSESQTVSKVLVESSKVELG